MKKGFYVLLISLLCFQTNAVKSQAATTKLLSFQAEGWADNWYSLYINGKKVGEDPVPITSTKSFNQTTIKFKASYPFTVGVVAKDYVENSSGLEYIGQQNQQIGDGGFVLQIRDLSTQKIIASTNSSWKALVIDKAPINSSCEKSKDPLSECKWLTTKIPSGWATASFKDLTWPKATEFTQAEVGVKDGFNEINWSSSARLIWSSDLRLDNTNLFRHIVKSPEVNNSSTNPSLIVTSSSTDTNGLLDKEITCDGSGVSPAISWSAGPAGTLSYVVLMDTIPGPARPGETEPLNHTYLALFNVPANVRSIGQGSLTQGTLGLNFKSKVGYEPPCSQGPGIKEYTIRVLALSSMISISQTQASQQVIEGASQNLVLASGKYIARYERK
jgi:phosphatidylethanolamine-binding protein (PEBP) family uncharacterized protein